MGSEEEVAVVSEGEMPQVEQTCRCGSSVRVKGPHQHRGGSVSLPLSVHPEAELLGPLVILSLVL